MATDLYQAALDRDTLLRTAAGRVTAALTAARAELRAPFVPDVAAPIVADLDNDELADRLGAIEHLRVARDRLAANATQEAATRALLAAVTNPAAVQTHEDELRALLIEAAALRVEVRRAEERVARAETEESLFNPLATATQAELDASERRVEWGEEQQERNTEMRARLAALPPGSIEAAATAALGGQEQTDADARLTALLPGELRTRAEARAAEAAAVLDEAAAAYAHGHAVLRARDADRHPRDVDVEDEAAELDAAQAAIDLYLSGAGETIDWAVATFASIADLPDLTQEQEDAIDAAAHADGVTAVGAEQDLADALDPVRAAQAALDDATLDALIEDVDRDPATVTEVSDAQDALDDAAIQDPLAAARAAYDAPAQADLDAWEVEVPPALWEAVQSYVAARTALGELAVPDSSTALGTRLDDAEDTLAAALAARDTATRTDWEAAIAHAERAGVLAAAQETARDRSRHYVRGDGPAGRLPSEL